MTIREKSGAHQVFIAVGSNLGNRIRSCRLGVDLLSEAGDVRVVKHSRYYYSAPLDYTEQPWFINAVFQAVTEIGPYGLIEGLKAAETEAGRVQTGIRFGPRVLDLDLIFYDNLVIHTPQLTLPHPRMHQRAFVLKPLSEIAPRLIHPVLGLTAEKLLEDDSVAVQQCIAVENKVIDKKAFA
ncbi:MAG: 2-amino-4-hydroxy-6-hydroxymethyldihydropteridine diphosphokinase [Desulfobacteraceae bacterium]|nr:2-amino-4-hydroxy-6-hydroxymethyldihydropteridine diphosphokinase [Desulfobacteraceae bacterium]